MGTHPITDERLLEIVEVCNAAENRLSACSTLGLTESTIRHHLRTAARRGLRGFAPVLDGFEIKQTSAQLGPNGKTQRQWITQAPERGEPFEVPSGHQVKGVSALLGPDGRVSAQWVKTQDDGHSTALLDAIRTTFDEYQGGAELRSPPQHVDADLATVYVIGDHHLGMYSWRGETGENYDLKIGEQVLLEAMEMLVSNAPASETAIILNLGDFFHVDNINATTDKGTGQDFDTRYGKVLQVGVKLMITCIELALQKHNNVIVRCLPGNHDRHTAFTLTISLSAFFHNNPRISVDCDPSKFFYWTFGRVFIAATHGDMAKPQQMPGIMAATQAEKWGATQFRYCYMGHIHHKDMLGGERFGVIVESFQSLTAKDAWHHEMGYSAGRSMVAITHHKEYGETLRHTVSVNQLVNANGQTCENPPFPRET